MKDALGHGSNAHNAGIDALGTTRYHTVKTAHWKQAQKRGYLDPSKYATGKIWTSTHPDEFYANKFENKFHGVEADETELAITLHPRHYLPTPGNEGGGSADRVTRVKVPLARVKEVSHTLPSREEFRKEFYARAAK